MVWIAGIVFLILLIIFPKRILYILIIIGILIGIYYIYDKNEAKKRAIEIDKVKISVKYNIFRCDKKYPLYISIKNRGSKIVNKVEGIIEIYKYGYSSRLKVQRYSTDKIMNTNEINSFCLKLPYDLNTNLIFSKLDYRVGWVSIDFKE